MFRICFLRPKRRYGNKITILQQNKLLLREIPENIFLHTNIITKNITAW
jgi:hypothetical protein